MCRRANDDENQSDGGHGPDCRIHGGHGRFLRNVGRGRPVRERRHRWVGSDRPDRRPAPRQFREDRPSRTRTIGTVFGLSGDTALVGIDFRPATGDLYGLGNAGGVYTLDLDDRRRRRSGRSSTCPFPARRSAWTSTRRSIGCGSSATRARTCAPTSKTASRPWTWASTMPAPRPAGVTGAAYTNNDLDANTVTTLFDIDSDAGPGGDPGPAEQRRRSIPRASCGWTWAPPSGFDIYSRLPCRADRGRERLRVVDGGRAAGFFTIHLFTGEANLRGWFGSRTRWWTLPYPWTRTDAGQDKRLGGPSPDGLGTV